MRMEALHRQLKEAVLRSGNMCRGTTTECDTGQECLDWTNGRSADSEFIKLIDECVYAKKTVSRVRRSGF